MRFWFLVFPLTVLLALPVWANPPDDLIKVLKQTKIAFIGNIDYASYLKHKDKVSTALDIAFYSQYKLSSGSLQSVHHVIRQMDFLNTAWIYRYTLGIKGIDSVNNVSFYYADQEKVNKAFTSVDSRIKLSDFLIAQGQEDGNGIYATYSYDRLLRASLDSISRNIDVSLNRLSHSQNYLKRINLSLPQSLADKVSLNRLSHSQNYRGARGANVRTGGNLKAFPVTGTLVVGRR